MLSIVSNLVLLAICGYLARVVYIVCDQRDAAIKDLAILRAEAKDQDKFLFEMKALIKEAVRKLNREMEGF